MGVKDLWNILAPVSDTKPVFELQGKVVAIDLSCWIVDSQMIADNHVQPKMYLRNLYFRTAFLLMQGIQPVFVLEGTAPTLKHKTIAKRNDIRNDFQERKRLGKGGRTQFGRILKECQRLLQYMGLACVQSHGEAEAMCAYLNADGLVDGCISQDSDCFLYGAKVVYRNFCVSGGAGSRVGKNGSIDVYTMDKIWEAFDIGRNKMIVLALLCGCDYDPGVIGVGKEAALKLFKVVGEDEILDRIKSWRSDPKFDRIAEELSNSNVCTSCGHPGKLAKHTKSGCTGCGTVVKCSDAYKEQRALIQNEITLRKKALLVENFPNQELLDEFLVRQHPMPSKIDLEWKQPQIEKFIHFVEKYLQWEVDYAFEKIFPLAARWQVLNLPRISLQKQLSLPNLFIPERIKKVRVIKTVASYEIVWKTEDTIAAEFLFTDHCDNENDNESDTKGLITIESQDRIKACYPGLVEEYETMLIEKKASKQRAKKASKRTVSGKPGESRKSEKSEPTGEKKQRQRAPRKKPAQVKNNKKIDEFIAVHREPTLEESFEKMSITPKRWKQGSPAGKLLDELKSTNVVSSTPSQKNVKRAFDFDRIVGTDKQNSSLNRMINDLSPDDFMNSRTDGDLNATEIVDNICSDQQVQFPSTNLHACTNDAQIANESPEKPDDVIELSDSGSEKADEKCEGKEQKMEDKSEDEFAFLEESYVPLIERVQKSGSSLQRKSVLNRISKDKFSLGIDDLLDLTDE